MKTIQNYIIKKSYIFYLVQTNSASQYGHIKDMQWNL